MNKEKILKIFYCLLLLSPVIDLTTSLMTKFINFPITLGMFLRGFIFIFIIIYVFFISKSKYKKISIIYLTLLCIFFLFYFLTKIELVTNFSSFLKEIIYLFKYMYFPVSFIGLINLFEDYKPNNEKIFKYLNINLIFYCSIILFSFLTNTSFSTYKIAGGTKGWFYAGNEIGAITTILYPLFLLLINKGNYKHLLLILPIIFSINLIGTKTASLGIFIFSFILLIYYSLKLKTGKKKQFVSIIIVILFIVFTAKTLPVLNVIKLNTERYYYRLINKKGEYSDNIIVSILFSDRDLHLKVLKKSFDEASLNSKLFGIGFSNNLNTEMDFFDILFKYGILIFILYCLPILYLIYKIIKEVINRKLKFNLEELTLIYTYFISLLIAFMAGHVLGAPSVSFYLSIIMVLLIRSFEKQ